MMGRFRNIHQITGRNKEYVYVGILKMNNECNRIAFNKAGDKIVMAWERRTFGMRGEASWRGGEGKASVNGFISNLCCASTKYQMTQNCPQNHLKSL